MDRGVGKRKGGEIRAMGRSLAGVERVGTERHLAKLAEKLSGSETNLSIDASALNKRQKNLLVVRF